MRLALFMSCCAALLAAGPAASHRVLRVPAQHASIQSAIDAAGAGDTVLVDPGVYRERIRFRGRALLLLSRAGPAQTIIDGDGGGTVVSFVSGEGPGAVLDGFTITGGRHPLDAGGIHVDGASPTLRHNDVRGNQGGRRGHGISIRASAAARVLDNRIHDNSSWPDGNGAGGGGGIGVEGSGAVEIRGNRIHDNRVTRHSSGGGIRLLDSGRTQVIGNRIEGNRARLAGAGIAIHGSSTARIENNLIVGNALSEPGTGGGVHWLIGVGPAGPDLIGNTIVDNLAAVGAGIHADGDDRQARIINNLVISRAGLDAIACGDFSDLQPPIVRRNILVGAASAGSCAFPDAGARHANSALVPTFLPGSWRLAPGSPGIDAGETAVVVETLDLDGRPRLRDGDGDGQVEVDIGALEGW